MEASSLPDLNCTPREDLDGGIIPAEGDAAAHQDVNALLAQDDADSGVLPGEGNSAEGGDAGNFAAFEHNAPAQHEGVNSTAAGAQPHMRLRKWLTDTQRYAVYTSLHAKVKNGKLPKSATKEVAMVFQAQMRVIQKIWKCATEQMALGQEVDVSNKRTSRVGRKKVVLDASQMAAIPLNRRSTLRSLAKSLGVSVPTLHRKFKLGEIRRHSSSLKPLLKDNNKRDRLKFCISMLDERTLSDAEPKFIDMLNIAHIDEKWYYMTKRGRTYYLLPEEEDPLHTIQNKNSIGKVMFLTDVARPRYDELGNLTFSGKNECLAICEG